MIVSRLRVENRASEFTVPEMVIAGREIVYESPVHFTPLRGESLVDGEALRALVLAEYRRAGLTRETVDTGAIIVTGETSRRENARQVLEALSDLAGDFVVATAGPDLESELAARGSGAVAVSEKTGKTILHMDIGGGTANLCLIRAGEIAATGCLNVGGRLLKLDAQGVLTYVSPVLKGLWSWAVGSRPTREAIEALCAVLARALEAAAGLTRDEKLLQTLTTAQARPLPLNAPGEDILLSFSGGVADCIAGDLPDNAFGDIGPALGRAIRKSALCRKEYLLGAQTIRATVIGAGCHSTTLSGSTVFCRDVTLPLQNLSAVTLSAREQDRLSACLPEKLRAAENKAIVALPGLPAPGYGEICALAEALLAAIPRGPLLICLEQDQAKALGQALACRTDRPILCIDRVRLPRGSYLDIGPQTGPAYPLVVKTLVFGKEQQQ